MNSLQKVSLLFVATMFLVALGVDRHHNLESFVAEPVQGSHNISVKWTVTDLGQVTEFVLERKMDNSQSVQVINGGCINQTGSNSFECVDSDIYKGQSDEISSTVDVTYVLHAYDTSHNRVKYGETVVEYTTNAVRRTWGSIKSMFQ